MPPAGGMTEPVIPAAYRDLLDAPALAHGDHRVSISIVDPANDYRRLEVRGRVIAIAADPQDTYLNTMSATYPGLETSPYQQAGSAPAVIAIEPTGSSQMTLHLPRRPERVRRRGAERALGSALHRHRPESCVVSNSIR